MTCMKLDAVPPAPGLARKFVESQLMAATVAQREAAILLTSELVTNAVLGSRNSLEVGVATVQGRVVVAVHDPNRLRGHPASVERRTSRNAGVMMMAALADEHGTVHHDMGRTVWAVLHEHGRAAAAGAVEEGLARRR
jgi:hypothetical protein